MLEKSDFEQIEELIIKHIEPLDGIIRAIVRDELTGVEKRLDAVDSDLESLKREISIQSQCTAEMREDIDYIKQKIVVIDGKIAELNTRIELLDKREEVEIKACGHDLVRLRTRIFALEAQVKEMKAIIGY
ncbi:MAG: hypothetical protein V1763_01625 [Parcubacteria group bacterium]